VIFSIFYRVRVMVFNAIFNNISVMGFELTTSVMIGTDCTGNCKSNYHTIIFYIWTILTKLRNFNDINLKICSWC